jgi:hypothetical protein
LSAVPARAATSPLPTWQSTNLKAYGFCFDGTRPDTLIVNATSPSSSNPPEIQQVNWKTGQTTKLNNHPFATYTCNGEQDANFLTFEGTKSIQFTPSDPQGREITYFPRTVSKDGSMRYYDLNGGPLDVYGPDHSLVGHYTYRLHVTEDGGQTWQERGQQFNGKIGAIAVNQGDSRAIYAVVYEGPLAGTNNFKHTLYFSQDAGISWQKNYEVTLPDNKTIYLGVPQGRSAPVGQLLYYEVSNSGSGSGDHLDLKISNDGGRTSSPVVSQGLNLNSINDQIKIYHTGSGLFQLRAPFFGSPQFFYSSDNGLNWKPVSLPSQYLGDHLRIVQFPNLSSSLVAYVGGVGWYSSDGGQTWQDFLDSNASIGYLAVTPYSPTTLVGITINNEVKVLDFPQADKIQTRGVAAGGSGSTSFATPTQHNYAYQFTKYWQDHGGLAQFGLPWTEAFREYNPADGKIYTVQYYERARFEYHPEFKGTQYEVLLGLLGNQLTEQRRAKGEGAFNRFPDMHYPGGIYFGETGHNLRNTFKDYWLANGGLAIYGYPTSEEFEEVNPDDGKTYIVQYFERNRFEYHPENKGTRYEVLLGLLGNSLLKQKGWL